MKYLLDANLSHRVADLLRSAGLDATHVREYDLHRADDEEIVRFAHTENRVIVSEDTDFGEILAKSGRDAPSLVLLRSANAWTPEQQATLLTANLPGLEEELGRGAVAVLEPARVRLRRLPLLPPSAETPDEPTDA